MWLKLKQKSRAIPGRTPRCRCKFRIDTYRILQRHRVVSLPQHGFLVGLCLQTADNARFLFEVSDEVATEIAKKNVVVTIPLWFDAPP